MQRIKKINSHSGYARFLAEVEETGRTIPRVIQEPYCFSPEQTVYRYKGKDVVVVEAAHRRYEVWEVA